MSKFEDLTGRKFGRLTASKRLEDKYYPTSGCLRVNWLCKCDCGREEEVLSKYLKRPEGRRECLSCGAARKSRRYKERKNEIIRRNQ